MIKKFFKKSQAEVVTTVLLILISIAAVGLIISFVFPFVQNQMAGGDCINVVREMEIVNNPDYTCYNYTVKNMSVQIHIGDLKEKSDSFGLSVSVGGSSKNYIIKSGEMPAGVYVRGGSDFPGQNEERTYIISEIDSKPDSIILYPILKNGNNCDASTNYNEISNC